MRLLLLVLSLTIGGWAGSAPAGASAADDFDGDGRSDLAVYYPTQSTWYIRSSAGNVVREIPLGGLEKRPVPADYDGDGITDVAVYQQTSSTWTVLGSISGQLFSQDFGGPGYRPIPADYDGDRRADLAVYNQDTGEWYAYASASGVIIGGVFGWPGARPIPADYDGDGKADPALYQRNTGYWYILCSASGVLLYGQLGGPTARPVIGDYDGDGMADAAIFDHGPATWWIRSSRDGQTYTVSFGTPASRPAPGDYDGDGITDLAYYERLNAQWTVRLSSDGSTQTVGFGAPLTAALPSYANGAIEGFTYVSFGDSITEGGGSSSDGPATGYPIILERILGPAFGGHFVSINAGKSGEDTELGLKRLPLVLDQYEPDLLLLMEGTNDHCYQIPFDEIEDNLRMMVELALARGIPVIIATIPPVITNEYRDRTEQARRIVQFNPTIYEIAADYDIPVAEVFEAITAVDNWEELLMEQISANHPNDAGYLRVRDAFYDAIAEGINRGRYD